jgi:hypothetical protein
MNLKGRGSIKEVPEAQMLFLHTHTHTHTHTLSLSLSLSAKWPDISTGEEMNHKPLKQQKLCV